MAAIAGIFLSTGLGASEARAAVNYQKLLSLGTPITPGQRPYAGLVQGSDGMLYGTTLQGGTGGGGTVFKLRIDGTGYSVLHSFSTNTTDGQSPGALVQTSDGALYGTTSIGGAKKAGTVYTINPDGAGYRLVHEFGTAAGDGQNPQAGLIESSDGTLYGPTFFGGNGDMGTVFALNRDGANYRILHHFTGLDGDGGNPDSALMQGSDGALYGPTFFGGTNDAGTVFKLNKDGTGYRVLRSFSRTGGDGNNPDAALVQASDGALYGTTSSGGTNKAGTVFKLNKDGTGYTIEHHFGTGSGDGQKPLAALASVSGGILYGTTYLGGSGNAGSVFRLKEDGTGYAVVRSFSSTGTDGQNPRATLIQGRDAALYGTTWSGGDLGFGIVFRITLSEIPEMVDVSIAGSAVKVRFSGMTGCRYEVWRSSDLVHWTLGDTIILSSPVQTYVDTTPPGPAAAYRAAWAP